MGKAWKFGENLNTDEIIPARYNITIIATELAKNVFCEIKPEYARSVQPGDVVVGGMNFGCGSSREHAPIAIRGSRARCVVAASFARIFFRNAINIGLPILECPEAAEDIEEGDQVEVDLDSGLILNRTKGRRLSGPAAAGFCAQNCRGGRDCQLPEKARHRGPAMSLAHLPAARRRHRRRGDRPGRDGAAGAANRMALCARRDRFWRLPAPGLTPARRDPGNRPALRRHPVWGGHHPAQPSRATYRRCCACARRWICTPTSAPAVPSSTPARAPASTWWWCAKTPKTCIRAWSGWKTAATGQSAR